MRETAAVGLILRMKWRAKFIQEFRRMGIVTRAAQAAGVDPETVYAAYKNNAQFAKEWDAAREQAGDRIEEEMWRRGHDGVDKPVFWQGEVCGTVREYDTTLLMALAKKFRPKDFRERHDVTIGNPDGSAIQIDSRQQAINLFMSSPEAAQHMIALSNLMVPEEPSMAKKLDPAEQRAAAALSAFTGKDVVIERIESLPDESGTGQPQSASPKSSPAPDTADMHDQNSGSGLPSPLLGESAQSNPEHVSNPKARKTRKAKKSAPQAEEIEIDDSDAQPLTGFPSLAAAFLPKPQ